MSYAVVTPGSAWLFVDAQKFTGNVNEHLAPASVEVQSYSSFFDTLKKLAAEWQGRFWWRFCDGKHGGRGAS